LRTTSSNLSLKTFTTSKYAGAFLMGKRDIDQIGREKNTRPQTNPREPSAAGIFLKLSPEPDLTSGPSA
jgi:hypothetical protein